MVFAPSKVTYSSETSLTMLIAFRVLGNPMNGRQKVMADTKVSRLLPTLRFPVACDFICRSVPPKAQRTQRIKSSLVCKSSPGTSVEVAKAKFS